MARGLLVVAVAFGGATCRIGDILRVKNAALLVVKPAVPESLKASSAYGSAALQIEPIDVSNDGGGELHWKASVKHGSPWIKLSTDTGTAGSPPLLEAMFDPSGLDSGVYEDTVIVEDRSGTGTSETPLWYQIHSCADSGIKIGDSVSLSLSTVDCAAPHRAGRFAKLYRFFGAANDSVSIEMSAAFDGYVILDTSLVATRPPVLQQDDCLGAPGDPCRYYISLPIGGTYWIEATSADSGETGAFKLRLLHKRKPTVPDSLAQFASDSVTPIDTGGVTSQTSVVVCARISDPDLADVVQLQAEVVPSGTTFTAATAISGAVARGSRACARQTVSDLTSYHWRVRAVDQTGVPGDWKEFPADPAFSVQSGHDPTFANANQYQSDGTTPIPVGGNANTPTVIFKAQVNDQDAGNTLVLQVEVKPVGTPFDSSVTAASGPVAPSATATVTVAAPTLVAGVDYHWQARVVDNTGRPINNAGWTSFGGNAETAVDFHVNAPANKIAWMNQPGADTAGRPIRPATGAAVQVAIQDLNGNTITSFNDPVTMKITTPPVGGQSRLLGDTTVNAVNGIATFSNLIVDTAGVGYNLTASINSGTLSSPESSPFNVVAAPATQLVFTVQPSSAVAGASIAPPIKVSAEDQFGNVNTSFTSAVTMAIANNAGSPTPGTLSGSNPVTAVLGVATFSNLSINKVGNGYTLRASFGTLTPDTSIGFSITPGKATHLVFTVPPSGAAATQIFNPPVKVGGFDVNENLDTSFTANVTVAIGTNPPGNGILSGTLTKPAVSGVATFNDLSIDKAGTGYTLTATSASLPVVSSPSFTITASSVVDAGKSTVLASPATITACSTSCSVGASTASLITVTARDAGGNPVPSVGATISVTGSGNSGVTGTVTTNASGVATWTLNSTVASSTAAELKIISAVINSVSITQKDTVTVNPGPPAAFEVTSQILNTTAGAAINAGSGGVIVRARDQFTNTATSFNETVQMGIAAPVGGTFAPTSTNTATASFGIATFPNLRIYQAGTGYQLRAFNGTLTPGLSNTFAINAGAPNKLTFTTQPTTTAVLARIDSAVGGVVVSVQDSVGNTVPFGGTVQVGIGNNGGGGTLTGGNAISAPTGIATFPNLRINALGTGYTLVTTSSGPALISDQSDPFNIVAGPPTKLAFGQNPSNATAGASISPAVTVRILDANGFLTSSTAGVTLAITAGTGTSGAHISGSSSAAVNGVATFSTLSIDSAGTNYTLSATSGTLTGTTSTPFTISAGPANKLAFGQQPTTTPAGATITPSVTVRILDALGNRTPSTASVVLSVNTGPPGGQLNGTKSVAAVAGVATFSDLNISKAGNYTLGAASSGLSSTVSATFAITTGTPTQLAFFVQPSNTTGGATMSQVQVEVQDVGGNRVTTATNSILLTFGNNAGPGAILSGTNPVSPVNGVATFSNLSIDSAGTGYTLIASTSGLTSATSTSFNVTVGPAAKLGFLVQPSNTTGGAIINPAVQVEVRDAGGNRVTSANNNITVALGTNPKNGTLSGLKTVAASSGLASFSTLAIDSAANGYTLTANANGLTGATSTSFNITVGQATKLGFHVQPSNTTAGATITPGVQVEVQDAGGNRVTTATNSIGIAIGTNAGGGTLSGTSPVSATNGIATFSDLSIDKIGTGYTLSANSTGLTAATSATFDITGGAATKLAFFVQPSSTTGGATMSTVQVEVQDAGGNRVTSANNNITVALGTNPKNGTLSGLKMVAASSGLASFSTLAIDSAANGYTLTANANGLTGATSTSFNITVGQATKLGFLVQPSNATGGAIISPAVQVEVRDAGGNRVTSANNSITVAIGTNPKNGSLGGTKMLAASSGVASFNNLSIDSAAAGYTLTANTTGLTGATSSSFTISVGLAAKLAFGQQPTSTTGGATLPPVTVRILDAGGNLTSSNATVDVSLATGTAGAHLLGTTSVAASGGVATFSTLSIDSAGTGYTLGATSGSLTPASSNTFTISVGSAVKLGFLVQPTDTRADSIITPAVVVEIRDAGGNRVTTATNQVTIAFGTNAGGGVLSGTLLVTPSAGLATFNDLSINNPANGYTLAASASGLTGATSATFRISP